MRLRSLIIALAGVAACSVPPLGGVKVTVRFLDTDAQCAKVVVTGGDRLTYESTPLPRNGKDRVVGVAQTPATGPAINVQAHGYLKTDCTGTPIDSSKLEQVDFIRGDVSNPVLLVLKGGATPDAGTPDAGPLPDAGVDAGMKDGGMKPDAGPEDCGNGVDDDQDGLTDCFDGDCLLQDCKFGRRCTSIGVCETPRIELVCNDGLDDDNDGKADCADPDCNNKTCADTNNCTYGETCQAGTCTAATTLTCSTPNECQMGAGTCLNDAGCGYAAKAGACDGGTCTNGECIIGFPFVPSNGFAPALPSTAIVPKVKLNCGTSKFDSDTLVFTNWCGQTKPIVRIINRSGLQNIVVLPMNGFQLDDELQLTGSKPVLLAVYGDALITGKLVASAKGAASGAGGPADNCGGFGEPGTAAIYSGGGGGGAGFAQFGTNGGYGKGVPFTGAAFGGIYVVAPNFQLRGGCSGTDGASGMMGAQAAAGGGAGGAVQLSVSGTLTIDGKVSANGGGGAGGATFNAGGGGAGSGGGILLEANLVKVLANARITAQGGGGGGGARDSDPGGAGEDGHDGDLNKASGGNKGAGSAGVGGEGGAATNPTGGENSSANGGGGGGAGTGRIHLRSISTCVTASGRLVSPVPTGDCP